VAVHSTNARSEAAMNYSYLCCACLNKLFTLKVIRGPPQQGVCSTSSILKIISSFQVAVIVFLQANAPLNTSCINELHLVYVPSASDYLLRAYNPGFCVGCYERFGVTWCLHIQGVNFIYLISCLCDLYRLK
jgi:hypothetical protein